MNHANENEAGVFPKKDFFDATVITGCLDLYEMSPGADTCAALDSAAAAEYRYRFVGGFSARPEPQGAMYE